LSIRWTKGEGQSKLLSNQTAKKEKRDAESAKKDYTDVAPF
jgi:hypothetical protein